MNAVNQKIKRNTALIGLAKWIYVASVCFVLIFVSLGITLLANLNATPEAHTQQYGASIYKYPLFNRYAVYSVPGSELRKTGLRYGRLLSVNGCKTEDFDALSALHKCANIDTSDALSLTYIGFNEEQEITINKSVTSKPVIHDYGYYLIDSVLMSLSLFLSLLLFIKAGKFLSGFLISYLLLLTVCESQFFYLGSTALGAAALESVRISIALTIGPIAMYFFPQAFDKQFWKRKQFILVCACIFALLITRYFFSYSSLVYVISITLIVLIFHFVSKYKSVLNKKERKQVITMLFCLSLGLILYFPLINFGGVYGFLIGRYILFVSIGLGVFFALMRYGLWQVESLISKSATLSILSIIAFSAWAGLDQGMQALLNQTIGLSNKTFTAFLAAAISSLFAVPAYNYISNSCDSFFNKDLHQLKRLLSKEILVLAETQTLHTFVERFCKRLLELSGAQKVELIFADHQRLPNAIEQVESKVIEMDEYSMVKKEYFSYEIDHILSVKLCLTYVDRRINREIKHELEEGTDEMARALASCSRWNYLENIAPKTSLQGSSLTPQMDK